MIILRFAIIALMMTAKQRTMRPCHYFGTIALDFHIFHRQRRALMAFLADGMLMRAI